MKTDSSNDRIFYRRRGLIAAGALCVGVGIVVVTLLNARDASIPAQPFAGNTSASLEPTIDIASKPRHANTAQFATSNAGGGPSSAPVSTDGERDDARAVLRHSERKRLPAGKVPGASDTAPRSAIDGAALPGEQRSSRRLTEYGQPRKEVAADNADDLQKDRLSISGRVLDDFGEPVAGLEINAVARNLFDRSGNQTEVAGEIERFTITQFDGAYTFVDLGDGEYDVRTLATPFYSAAQMLVRAGADAVNLMVTRQRELLLHGTVENAQGRPLAAVRVLPIGQATVAMSDEQGRFEVRLLIKSNMRQQVVRFDLSGYQVTDLRLDESEWQGLDAVARNVVLRGFAASAEVSGTVTGDAGAVVAGETIQLTSPSRKRRYFAVTDHNGSFLLRDVEVADDYQLWIRPKRLYRDFGESNLEVTQAGLALQITLAPLSHGSLSGRMINMAGEPVAHFTLWLRNTMAAGQSVQLTSDANGKYTVDDVPLGAVIFETRSFPIFRVSGVFLSSVGEQNVDIVLDRGAHVVHGRVLNRYGDAVPGAEVFLRWNQHDKGVSSRSTRRTVAEEDGYFAFNQLAAGAHTLNVRAPGFRSANIDHQVGADEREIEVLLEDAL